MISPPAGARILLAAKPVDFRKGAHSLAALAAEVLGADPFSGAVLVFRSRRADRIKILLWDGSGLVLVWKQLEGGTFRWPPVVDGVLRLPETPVTQPGDVWRLGRHRLACGDSTDAAVVAAVLAGVRPHLMVTDPPYGVAYDPAWRNRAGLSATTRTGKVENDHRADWREAWALFPGEVAYVWHGALHATTVADSLAACGFEIRAQIIWAKDRLVLGRGHYHWQHEPCWYAVRGRGHWAGDRKQTTLWQITGRSEDAETVHGTQKPVECMRRPIENNSSPGQAVYEPFSGSGTTLIAAEMAGRCCHAIELSPAYVDVAVARWEAFTGEAAVREADGALFSGLAPGPAGGAPVAPGEAAHAPL